MERIYTVSDLKNAIQVLEVEQAAKGQHLKEQFYITYENLKPFKLLQSALKDVASSPYLIENILSTVMGLTSGYLSKRIVVGASGNVLRKFMGSLLQMGVTNAVVKHPDSIKSIGQFIFHSIFHKKDTKLKVEDESKRNKTDL
jgi:hypothetical protein